MAWLPDGSVALRAYSPLEAVALPGAAYRLLVRFTGEPAVEEVRTRLRAEEHGTSPTTFLQRHRQRVLVDPPRSGRRG